jgi:small subunit ribosomal protein S2
VAIVQVQELIEAGVHYGHRSSRWNPKMRPYIYGRRNLIHIIDLRETIKGMVRGARFLTKIASQGSLVLFIGTKRQAQEAIVREASRVFSPYVSERWIGGTFTNFRTIRDRLARLQELERLMDTGEILKYSKKRRATLLREWKKMHRNLSGIRTMNRLPGAIVVVDPRKEASAIKEARSMGIPTVALIDTDSDPDTVDLAIPCNDDSIRSIDLILKRLADAVREGMGVLPSEQVSKFEADFAKAHNAITPEEAAAKLAAHAVVLQEPTPIEAPAEGAEAAPAEIAAAPAEPEAAEPAAAPEAQATDAPAAE